MNIPCFGILVDKSGHKIKALTLILKNKNAHRLSVSSISVIL
ncbi:hypothetical protein NBRC111894_2201 [Sporolactobacillus inulinus]|uniref:Uncharacterized protein n=1 Tax=Sporolactobacillus inulinus TaxID=2078 RepID=A0A4Y1ZC48_9BACL|nr:hypothetical protein NBRC111894_2201 [Sporolactobacillus inulinus]